MTTEELMRLSAEKALREMSWKSIEFLFRPANMLELLLRIDFDGMSKKITDWAVDMSPDAMPHRFRPPYIRQLDSAREKEKFYREMVRQREENESDRMFRELMKEKMKPKQLHLKKKLRNDY